MKGISRRTSAGLSLIPQWVLSSPKSFNRRNKHKPPRAARVGLSGAYLGTLTAAAPLLGSSTQYSPSAFVASRTFFASASISCNHCVDNATSNGFTRPFHCRDDLNCQHLHSLNRPARVNPPLGASPSRYLSKQACRGDVGLITTLDPTILAAAAYSIRNPCPCLPSGNCCAVPHIALFYL